MSRTSFALLKARLSSELVEVMARWRDTGEAPTAETAPLLMRLWTAAHTKLINEARSGASDGFYFRGVKLQVFSLWGIHGFLQRFYLRDYFTGELLLIGDARGPILSFPESNQKALK